MNQLIVGATSLAIGLIFLFGAPLLNLVGWTYSEGGGSFLTKIHPASFLFAAAAGLAVISGSRPVIDTIRKPSFILFAIASLIFLAKATFITMRGANEGELSSVIDTFLTPLFAVIAVSALTYEYRLKLVPLLRIFFVANSLMALGERILGIRFIPSFLDHFSSFDRAAGLLGHPLNAALLTGAMIVYLLTSTQSRASGPVRFVEIGLHAIALFAFGGRSALVFTAAVLIISAVTPDLSTGARRVTPMQRILPLLIMLAGISLVFLPIPFIDATLDRFTNDKGSADTRNAAVHLLTMIDTDQLLYGISAAQRQIFMRFLNTPAGFEVSWIALTVTYGLLATIVMAFALPIFLFANARGKDRSAFFIALLTWIVTIGSLSIGVKSLLISQILLMTAILTSIPPARPLSWAGAGRNEDVTPRP